MRTLILELPDEQVRTLEREAQRRGKSVNDLVAEWVCSLSADDGCDVRQDPIYNIKAHDTGAPPDLSLNVDHYLYGAKKR